MNVAVTPRVMNDHQRRTVRGRVPSGTRLRRLLEAPSPRARLGLTVLAAVLFAASFPPVDGGIVLGWVALVPLAFAVRGLDTKRAAIQGGVFGLAAAHLVFAWIFRFPEFRAYHGLFFGSYLGLYTAAIAVGLARYGFEARGLVIVPAIAVVAEWLRGHAGFLALPWATFGQTQHVNTAILQLAPIGGEHLMSLVVVLVNVASAQLARWGSTPKVSQRIEATERLAWRAPVAAIAIAVVAHVYGLFVSRSPLEGDDVVVAAVQPAILPKHRNEQSFERLLALTRDLKGREVRPALVVWPETAVGNIEVDLATKLAIRDVVEEISAPIVFGASETEKLVAGGPQGHSFNSAYVMSPRTPVPAPYRKVRLLPFAEYRPMKLPEWIVPAMFETEAGAERTTLRAGELLVEPVICWENLFADEVRATATDEPSIIAHVVNDAWFGPTSQPELHNLVSAIRAAESGRPVVVASNTGPSWIIDARGKVVARTARAFEPGIAVASVKLPSGRTLYRRHGDATWAVPVLLAVALVASVADRRRATAGCRCPRACTACRPSP